MSTASETKTYQPGEWVEEKKAIFIGEFDDLVRADIPVPMADTALLKRRTRWYDACLDVKPATFDEIVKAIGALNANGRTGITFEPAVYEEKLFEAIRAGEAVNKFVVAPLAVIDAIHALKKQGQYKQLADEKKAEALRVDGSGSGYDRWQWSASQGRYGDEYIRVVDFTDGYHGWEYRNANQLSARACFCEVLGETQYDGVQRVAWAAAAATEIKSAE